MIWFLVDQLPDESAALQLLELFDKLLKKYANLLGTEDAYEDLRLFFLDLLAQLKGKGIRNDNDGYIVSYISKSVKHQYIAMSKAQDIRKEDLFSDISEEQMYFIEQIASSDNSDDISTFFPTNNELSEREQVILRQFFAYGYSIGEIAQQLGISRQAVNQAKNRALGKIRKAYLGKKQSEKAPTYLFAFMDWRKYSCKRINN